MHPHDAKSRSRGISRGMSPQAITRRFDILVELEEVARALSHAKRAATPGPNSSEASPPTARR